MALEGKLLHPGLASDLLVNVYHRTYMYGGQKVRMYYMA